MDGTRNYRRALRTRLASSLRWYSTSMFHMARVPSIEAVTALCESPEKPTHFTWLLWPLRTITILASTKDPSLEKLSSHIFISAVKAPTDAKRPSGDMVIM